MEPGEPVDAQMPLPPLPAMRNMMDKLRALTRSCRYDQFPAEFVHIDHRGERWVQLESIRRSKKRFSEHSVTEIIEAALGARDHAGRNRFLVHTDAESRSWMCCPLVR